MKKLRHLVIEEVQDFLEDAALSAHMHRARIRALRTKADILEQQSRPAVHEVKQHIEALSPWINPLEHYQKQVQENGGNHEGVPPPAGKDVPAMRLERQLRELLP